MLKVVLYQPLNPHNTGAIARTCAMLGAELHLVRPLGFEVPNRDLRREPRKLVTHHLVVERLVAVGAEHLREVARLSTLALVLRYSSSAKRLEVVRRVCLPLQTWSSERER